MSLSNPEWQAGVTNTPSYLTCGPYRCSSSAAARIASTSVMVRPSAPGCERQEAGWEADVR